MYFSNFSEIYDLLNFSVPLSPYPIKNMENHDMVPLHLIWWLTMLWNAVKIKTYAFFRRCLVDWFVTVR